MARPGFQRTKTHSHTANLPPLKPFPSSLTSPRQPLLHRPLQAPSTAPRHLLNSTSNKLPIHRLSSMADLSVTILMIAASTPTHLRLPLWPTVSPPLKPRNSLPVPRRAQASLALHLGQRHRHISNLPSVRASSAGLRMICSSASSSRSTSGYWRTRPSIYSHRWYRRCITSIARA